MEQKNICHECGNEMVRDVRPIEFSYKGQSITVDMPGWYCSKCSESTHSMSDMKVSDRALNVMKARHERLLAKEEIKRIRKKLRLTQLVAGEILGGGPKAFTKYENGDLLPSRAVSNLLRLLDACPEQLAVLAPPLSKTPAPGRRKRRAEASA